MARGKVQPMAERLVVVPGDLLRGPQAAPPHDDQQGAGDLLGWGAQPVERCALRLAEPGAAAQAVIALMPAHMPIAHDMRLLAVAIGAGRTGSRLAHRVSPPTLPPSNSYASPVTTRNSVHGGNSTCVYTAKVSLVSFAGRPAYYC